MDMVYTIGAFAALPYLLWALVQAIRGKRIGILGLLLAVVAVVVPLGAVLLGLQSAANTGLITLLVINAVLAFVLSLVVMRVEGGKKSTETAAPRKGWYGRLGLLASMVMAIGIFAAPMMLTAAVNSGTATAGSAMFQAGQGGAGSGIVLTSDTSGSTPPEVVTALTVQTGLTLEGLSSQLNDGASISSLVSANNGDLEAVRAALTEALTTAIADGILPSQMLTRLGGDAASVANAILDGQVPAQFQAMLLQSLISGEAPAVPGGMPAGQGSGGTQGSGEAPASAVAVTEASATPVVNQGFVSNTAATATPAAVTNNTSQAVEMVSSVPTATMTPIFIPTLMPQALGTTVVTTAETTAVTETESGTSAAAGGGSQAASAVSCTLVVDFNLNLRSEPNAEATRLLTIPYTTVLNASQRSEEGWYRVTYEGQEGWIDGAYTTVTDSCLSLS